MAYRKIKTKDIDGTEVEGLNIPITKSTEALVEYTLDDGTVLGIKTMLVRAVRVHGKWDDEGNPYYLIKHQQVVSVLEAPEELKERTS